MEASLLNIKDSTSQDIERDFYRVQLSIERASFGSARLYSPLATCHCIFPSHIKIYKLVFHSHP